MLHFYLSFSFLHCISSIVIDKFSFYCFLNYSIYKMIVLQLSSNLPHFYSSSAMKTCYFCSILSEPLIVLKFYL